MQRDIICMSAGCTFLCLNCPERPDSVWENADFLPDAGAGQGVRRNRYLRRGFFRGAALAGAGFAATRRGVRLRRAGFRGGTARRGTGGS
jgi:hypothetical protein